MYARRLIFKLTGVETLEKILLDSEGNQKASQRREDESGCIYHAALLLAKELQPETGVLGRALDGDQQATQSLQPCGDTPSTTNYLKLENGYPSRKRKRLDEALETSQVFVDQGETRGNLPRQEILKAIIDSYLSSTHHWVPFLHPFRFKRDIENPQKRPNLNIILHAIVYASMHRLDPEIFQLQQSEIERQVKLSRDTVILNALDSLMIENVQALIIVAFTAVSSPDDF